AAGELGKLNRKGLLELVRAEEFKLGSGRYKLSSLANPQILIREDKAFELQMGSDIPYNANQQGDQVTTLFRFAGLKITGTLSSSNLSPILDYQIELSAPGQSGVISGNKKSSSIMIEKDKPLQAFHLSYINQVQDQKSLPGIGAIPILRELLSSTIEMSEEKVIIETFTLERL